MTKDKEIGIVEVANKGGFNSSTVARFAKVLADVTGYHPFWVALVRGKTRAKKWDNGTVREYASYLRGAYWKTAKRWGVERADEWLYSFIVLGRNLPPEAQPVQCRDCKSQLVQESNERHADHRPLYFCIDCCSFFPWPPDPVPNTGLDN